VDVFLRINGFHIAVEAGNAHRKIIKMIEEGTRVKESLETFLRQYTVES
ncbi:MAG: prophage maintenance system killer protein, partial [Candidatus Azotimanducaceae bacterium]